MINVSNLLLPFLYGILIGVSFFSSLWWSVRQLILNKLSAWWFSAGVLLRVGLALLGFYLAMGSRSEIQWERLTACLIGFSIARFIVRKLIEQRKEVSHAT